MPLLEAETSLYPENLLDDEFNQIDAFEQPDIQWWAIYTKARQEKALARDLLTRGVPFYLPLVAKDYLIRGRKARSYLPLFTGYLFVYGADEQRIQCLKTNRISQIISVVDQSRLKHDLRNVNRLIASDAPLTIERRLSRGARVRIKSGPMLGLEGMVLSRRGQRRLLVSVDFLQQGASIEIEDFQVEPA